MKTIRKNRDISHRILESQMSYSNHLGYRYKKDDEELFGQLNSTQIKRVRNRIKKVEFEIF